MWNETKQDKILVHRNRGIYRDEGMDEMGNGNRKVQVFSYIG